MALGLFNEIANWNLFKSEEEKEKERLAKIYTNPVTGEVEQYASGLMGMRPEVINQIKTSAQQNMQGMLFGAGPQFTALENVPMQGTVAAPDPMATMRANLQDTYDLSTGKFKGKEAVEAVSEATKGMSPNTLITLLSAFQQDKTKAPTITDIPTATRGLMFDDEDPYERYRRQGGIF